MIERIGVNSKKQADTEPAFGQTTYKPSYADLNDVGHDTTSFSVAETAEEEQKSGGKSMIGKLVSLTITLGGIAALGRFKVVRNVLTKLPGVSGLLTRAQGLASRVLGTGLTSTGILSRASGLLSKIPFIGGRLSGLLQQAVASGTRVSQNVMTTAGQALHRGASSSKLIIPGAAQAGDASKLVVAKGIGDISKLV